MPRKKKQENQPNIEVPKAEGQSESTTAFFAETGISPASTHLIVGGNDAGYIVKCGMCGTDIWTSYIDDDLVFVCGPCADTLPD